jgi:hypothetical protein
VFFSRGQTALHVAVKNGERKICYLLVSAGAPLLAVDKHDRTAQQIAEQTRDYDLAKYLECKYLAAILFSIYFRGKITGVDDNLLEKIIIPSPIFFSNVTNLPKLVFTIYPLGN